MRYWYLWVQTVLGVVLIAAPFIGKFTKFHPASYTDEIVGVVVVVWALVGYRFLGMKTLGMRGTRA